VEAFRSTRRDRLPHLTTYRLQEGTLIYVCNDQQSGQWLTEAVNKHRLKKKTLLKAMDAKDLPKPVQMILRT
jgi:hypothetical protein